MYNPVIVLGINYFVLWNGFHITKGKGKVFYVQEPPSGESTPTECGVNYQLLAVITEAAQWELLVAINHNQLQTMASETVDPIDWSHPPRSWAVPPERLVHSINQCTQLDSNVQPQHVRQPPCLCGHSGYGHCVVYVKRLIAASPDEILMAS